MSNVSPNASLISLPTTEGDTVTPAASTTALLPESTRADTSTPAGQSKSSPSKDYEAAFAALSSSYGFGGTVPTKNPAKSKKGKDKKNKDGKGTQLAPSSEGQNSIQPANTTTSWSGTSTSSKKK
ncbi:hypothetical protein C8Q70DRAFT_936328 [Cubamyces menziesii]|nr:hypothetical protein C8Q70DRAFT_936328 [Cubamyces menziesii]